MEDINTRAFEELIFNEEETAMVLFSRKTCHVCQAVQPLLEDIYSDYKESELKFYHVDVEEEAVLFQKLSLKGVPQVLFYKNGTLVSKLSGEHEDEDYISKIEELID